MANDLYPMWGESSAAIAPQMYNWAAMNYGNQAGNIARLGDYDRQAIANRQNYFQAQRAIEAEDAQREEMARREAERLALAQGESLRRNYQFGQEQQFKENQAKIHQAFLEKQLKASIDAEKMRYAPLPEPKPGDYLDELNAYVADLRVKTAPEKFNHDAVAGLTAKLPASIRSRVTYDPETYTFSLQPERVMLRNPFGDPVSVLPENAPKAIGGWKRAVESGAYNFAPTGTGTTPPPVSAAAPAATREIIPPYGNMGGGYFPPIRPAAVAPAAQAAPATPAPMQGEFLIMKNPQGRPVKVRYDQIGKARALGYYE